MTDIHDPDFNSPSGRKIEETKITREDVEQLKVDWAYHPIWDIEDTEGFEGFRDELFEYRKQEEAKWEAKWKQETQDRARELGVSVETMTQIERLENTVAASTRNAVKTMCFYLKIESEVAEEIFDDLVAGAIASMKIDLLKATATPPTTLAEQVEA